MLSKLLSTAQYASLAAIIYLAFRRWQAKNKAMRLAKQRKLKVERDILVPVMDVKRQAAIAHGEAIDHCGCCIEAEDPAFNLDSTIFFSLKGKIPRAFMRKQLARTPHWSDEVVQAIKVQYEAIPKAPTVPKPILSFMLNECNFKMEHADGSFMDHISFCHDYCAEYYKGHSPMVLLLHSIMGVGTNVFPMDATKIPALQKLVSTEDFKHIEVFPSVLRLLVAGDMLEELRAQVLKGGRKLSQITMRRVIDNKEVKIDAETFWVHLNYHLIHWVDFLPVADWPLRISEPLFQGFLELRDFLEAANQLRATVNLGSMCGAAPSQEALLATARKSAWPRVKKSMQQKSIRKFSAAIGHSLEYSLQYC
mmetsp:Transcript_96031/g.200601  ORF Transcript_96031/g.200601 Transcript_96031/m.200601 type:complete len:365 (+) Transcript_96031:104-1198(+)|eukprot:CAMPEP_0206500584 /NCGR_PEP_ID=MMETSP0324_2-20121206/52642_1 /ASSEMBLY_ACC=CAM_ASM_000836 /TAXON_ID=2866 /ORGANISM="Crypthecodinium cohnii, Strain Seligo" /LENGTH=364 /DNA_ID=CAMNT_0053987921 /DNA_START=77 /DNA_END=1171 /DNA_ORIENTATION=-